MKKKLLIILFVSVLLLCSCGNKTDTAQSIPNVSSSSAALPPESAPGTEPQAEPEIEAYYTLSEDGKYLTVSLYSNPTTGYKWQWGTDKSDYLRLAYDDFIADESGVNVGVGGMWEAHFAATMVNFGELQLVLSYERAWESEPISTHVLTLNIDSSGTIQVLSAK